MVQLKLQTNAKEKPARDDDNTPLVSAIVEQIFFNSTSPTTPQRKEISALLSVDVQTSGGTQSSGAA